MQRVVRRLVPKPKSSVFICGCGHTGSSLLARILAAHSSVFSFPYETGAFDWNERAKWHRAIIALTRVALSGRDIWVEKSPSHIHHTDKIRTWLPNAQFIVTTRDGRDVVASLAKRHGDFEVSFKRWLRDSKASRLCLEQQPSVLWRYEDFIDDPGDSLAALCGFIGVPFEPDMLDYHKKQVAWGRSRKTRETHSLRRRAQVNEPIRDFRGAWKETLPPEVERRFHAGEAKELMAYFGYT